VIRRLTRAEYNYTICDLTGGDLRRAEQFLEDSVAGEGFANTGDAFFMAPELIPKYLEAAGKVSDHAVLTPSGIPFSVSDDPHALIAEAVQRIQGFVSGYTDPDGRLPIAVYVAATLVYRERNRSANLSLEEVSAQRQLSPKYLRILWTALNDPHPTGKMADAVRQWRAAKTAGVEGLYDAATHVLGANSSDRGEPTTF
jgi:hypothetical protein